jgi:hypothetical protein
MYWNHRLIKQTDGNYVWYAIHEVSYEDDGKIIGCTAEATAPSGEDVTEVKLNLTRMEECMSKPILDYDKDIGIHQGKLVNKERT